MKKKTLPFVILLSLLILLIAGYVLLTNYNKDKADREAAESESEDTSITVGSITSSDITAISYKTEELDISLELSGGKWVIADDEKYPVDQTAVSSMLSAVTSITASRELESSDADFGLDTPSLMVTLTANGAEITLSLGNVNSYNSETYLSYDGRVYMAVDTLSSVFAADKDELFAAEDTFPSAIDSDSVTSVTVRNAKGDEASVTDSEGIEDIVYEAQKYFSFAILKGYGLDSDGLAEYGITDDSASIVIEYDYNGAKATFEVLLGKNADGDCFYAVPGGSVTYGIDTEGYDTVMSYAYYTPAETSAETTTETTAE